MGFGEQVYFAGRAKPATLRLGLVGLQFGLLFLATPGRIHSQASLRDSATAYVARGDAAYRSTSPAEIAAAIPLVRRAIDLYARRRDHLAEASAATLLGQLQIAAGRADLALVPIRRAEHLYRTLRHPTAELLTLETLAQAFEHEYESDSARKALTALLTLARVHKARGYESAALERLGGLAYMEGQTDSGLVLAHAALHAATSAADGGRIGDASFTVGMLFLDARRPDSAIVYLRAALNAARAAAGATGSGRDAVRISRAMMGLAAVFERVNRRDSAGVYARMAVAAAPPYPSSERAEAFLIMGRTLRVDSDSSSIFLRRALSEAIEAHDAALEGDVRGIIGLNARNFGRIDESFAQQRAALILYKRTRNWLGEAVTGEYLGDLFQHAGGAVDSALTHYRAAREIYSTKQPSSGAVVRSNLHLAFVFRAAEQVDSAIAYYRLVLQRQRDPNTLAAIGLLFGTVSQFDSAQAYAREAMLVVRSRGPGTDSSRIFLNIGHSLYRSGIIDSAYAYMSRSLAIRRYYRDPPGQGQALMHLAEIHRLAGRLDSAIATGTMALPLLRATGQKTSEGRALMTIAEAQAALRRPDSSIASYGSALELLRAAGFSAGVRSVLRGIAEVYRTRSPQPDLERAAAYYDSAATNNTRVRRAAGSDPSAVSFAEGTRDLTSGWMKTWLGRASEVGKGRSAKAALAAVERGRAQALLDLMSGSGKGRGSVSSSLNQLTTSKGPGADLAAETDSILSALRRRGSAALSYTMTDDTLYTWLLLPSGGIAASVQQAAVGEVEVFRRAISQDTLTELIGAFRDGLGAANLGARSLRGVSLEPATADLPKSAASRRRTQVAEDLASILLPSAVLSRLGAVKEVVIVPQGPIALVPFAALSAGGSGLFGSKVAIRYAPSLATLSQTEARPALPTGAARPVSLKLALIVGNPTMPEVAVSTGTRDKLAPLPGAESESRSIASQLGVKPLTGADATEAEVVRRLPNATVVHLATHGYAYSSESKARSSFVALSPDTTHDGLLTVGKILDNPRLNLSADLVVLSACQTGLGNLRQAEGTVGLQRAFLARGARSVLVSLWSVSDAATSALMNAFYTHWLTDRDAPSKAEALRRAQEQIRQTPGWEHPRFWAAFQLVGAK